MHASFWKQGRRQRKSRRCCAGKRMSRFAPTLACPSGHAARGYAKHVEQRSPMPLPHASRSSMAGISSMHCQMLPYRLEWISLPCSSQRASTSYSDCVREGAFSRLPKPRHGELTSQVKPNPYSSLNRTVGPSRGGENQTECCWKHLLSGSSPGRGGGAAAAGSPPPQQNSGCSIGRSRLLAARKGSGSLST